MTTLRELINRHRQAQKKCICARCAKYDGCPNAAPPDEDNIPGYEGICADCREDRRHAGHTPEEKPLDDFLRDDDPRGSFGEGAYYDERKKAR